MPILRNFTKGLALSPSADLLPDGLMRSNRGLSATAIGSFRSRYGSLLIAALNAHSIFYFSNLFWYGVGTSLYRSTVSKLTGLSGNRLTFAKCPPVAGIVDYLFFTGGGALYKSDSAGNITNWGINAPLSNPSAVIAAGGFLTVNVKYQYMITYKNSITGHRSNPNPIAANATTSLGNLTINLSAIPDGSAVDSQVDKIEIWRTEPDGVLFFYLTQINAGTTTYSDTGAIGLSSTELPIDNDEPFSYFDDCLGPFNASMFWITRTQPGQRGRIFYSPIGRCESMEGYIEVTADSNPLKKLFRFQGQFGVIAESGIFLIGGDNPYVPREIPECPGTIEPFSVVETPYGIVYRAADGVRIFDGSSSTVIAPGSIDRLFRGEAVGDLLAFTSPVVATFARNECIVADANQSIAINKEGISRDLGIGITAIYYSSETDQIAVTYKGNVVAFEKIGRYTDNNDAISIMFESPSITTSGNVSPYVAAPPHITTNSEVSSILQFLAFDINTNNEQLVASVTIDDIPYTLGTIQTASRQKVTFNIGRSGKLFAIRLVGSVSAIIEIFAIQPSFYSPK